jgi:hypothetical protein
MLRLDDPGLSDCCADHALEFLYKAQVDPPDSRAIWAPHPDPLIRDEIADFYNVIADRLRSIMGELEAFVLGRTVLKAFRPDERDVLAAVARLRGRDPRSFNVDDWLALIDWLILRYLPQDTLQTEGEYMAVRAAIAGRIKALEPTAEPGHGYVAMLPRTISQATIELGLPPSEVATLRIASARAGEAITNLGEQTRHQIKGVILRHLEARAVGATGATARRLDSQLFQEFGILNRDWRRVAVTEVGNMVNEGVIGALPVGATVKRLEHYEGACPFCREIDGLVMVVVSPSKPNKDGWKEVWEGKTNYGRSASPYKREAGHLVKRPPEEMYWPAAGLQHPSCRGHWFVINSGAERDSRTRDFVAELLRKRGLVVKPAAAAA